MTFSFCLNKNEILILCGLSILYQGLELKQEGKLMKDGQRLVATVIQILEKADSPGAADFKKLSTLMTPDLPAINLSDHSPHATSTSISKSAPSPSASGQQARPQIYHHANPGMSESDILSQQLRRVSVPSLSPCYEPPHGRSSFDSARSEPLVFKREYQHSASQFPPPYSKPRSRSHDKPPNLDYLSLSNTPVTSQPHSPVQARSHLPHASGHTPIFTDPVFAANKQQPSGVSVSEWETLLSAIDGGHPNLYDAIYGGSAPVVDQPPSNYGDWSPESRWDMAALSMSDFGPAAPGAARSVLSSSEESLSSGEDLSTSEFGGLGGKQDYSHQMMGGAEHSLLEGLSASLGL